MGIFFESILRRLKAAGVRAVASIMSMSSAEVGLAMRDGFAALRFAGGILDGWRIWVVWKWELRMNIDRRGIGAICLGRRANRIASI